MKKLRLIVAGVAALAAMTACQPRSGCVGNGCGMYREKPAPKVTVYIGDLCTVLGQHGTTTTGNSVTCKTSKIDGKKRWSMP